MDSSWKLFKEQTFSCPFQLREASCNPWLVTLPLPPRAVGQHLLISPSPTFISTVTSPSLALTLLPSSFKEISDHTGPTWLIQDNLPTLNLITIAKSFLPCKVIYSQAPGIRIQIFEGPLFGLSRHYSVNCP